VPCCSSLSPASGSSPSAFAGTRRFRIGQCDLLPCRARARRAGRPSARASARLVSSVPLGNGRYPWPRCAYRPPIGWTTGRPQRHGHSGISCHPLIELNFGGTTQRRVGESRFLAFSPLTEHSRRRKTTRTGRCSTTCSTLPRRRRARRAWKKTGQGLPWRRGLTSPLGSAPMTARGPSSQRAVGIRPQAAGRR
jgi:hypothetical protein